MRLLREINWLRLLLAGLDAAVVNLVFIAALWLRFEGTIPAEWWDAYIGFTPWFTLLCILSCYLFGLYNRVWQYARAEAALSIAGAISLAVGIGVLASFVEGLEMLPRSVLAMTWGFAILSIGGMRFGWRQIRQQFSFDEKNGKDNKPPKTLIYGAGEAGNMLSRHMDFSPDGEYQIAGFVDDASWLHGMLVSGHKVLGSGPDLVDIVPKRDIEQIIIAIPSATGEEMRQILDYCNAVDVKAATLPRLLEITDDVVDASDIRPVEYEDLLGRASISVGEDLEKNYIEGRRILVTGAGGSIGSEICRQMCRWSPEEVLLLGRGENRIHAIYNELRAEFSDIAFEPIICNFTNAEHVTRVFDNHRPEVVFHAGAHKHVYLMEAHPVEAIRNNVIGTGIVAKQAAASGVDRFVMISTDKAVDPCNVMGATKRLCEILCQQMNNEVDTTFGIVRFGNVIGSSGSVLKIFEHQAQEGRPLTVTHPDVMRYFMTVEEAAYLVLHAGALAEDGEIFVLDMGEPVSILQLARDFLKIYGRDPDEPGAIQMTELRPGEKLHESLASDDEELTTSECPHINCVRHNCHPAEFTSVDDLLSMAEETLRDSEKAQELLGIVREDRESILTD